jgi:RHS repeat-associated protein
MTAALRASSTASRGVRVPLGERASYLGIEWDAEDRLTRVTQGPTELARFAYDGQGRRAQKIVGGVTHTYIYDKANIIEERLSSGQTYDYVQGPAIDQPLAMRDQASVVSYYLADHLGSIVQTTSSTGAVTLTREYDPWGNALQGSTTAGYAFTGREWDAETNLYYYRARYYDPKIGRFISEDPIGFKGGINFYAYVDNRPTIWTDPSGLVIKRCFRPLKGGASSVIAAFLPLAFLVQPPVPGVSFCPAHEYIFNTATGMSKGHGPGQEPPETGKDLCYVIPEPVGQCVWDNWNPGPYRVASNNCEEAINNAVSRCKRCQK